MPERVNPSLQMPGYSAGTSQPGVAKKLIVRAQRGEGIAQAEVAKVNRAFRLKREAGEQPWHPLPRDVKTVEAVTRGLGLDQVDEERVQKVVGDTRADGGPKSQTQRIFLATNALATQLRAMPEVSSDARMEIARRARSFWMNTQQTDYGKEPTVRAPLRPQAREDLTMKSQRFVVGEPLVKKMQTKGPPTKGAKKTGAAKPAKESWSAKRERELNDAYKAKQAAAKQAKTEAKGAPKKGPPTQGAMQGPPKPAAAPSAPQPPMAGAPPGTPPQAPPSAPQKPSAMPAQPEQGASAMSGPSNPNQPPPGFSPIPHSAKGGFRKQEAGGWVYWYPGAGVTSTPHPQDRGGARNARSAAESPMLNKPKGKGAAPVPPGAPQGAEGPQGMPASEAPVGGPQKGAAGPQGAAQGGAGPEGAAAPVKAFPKPQITRDAQGEKRSFHPDVHAVTPPGKEGDKGYHAEQYKMHHRASKQAARAGDNEKAQAHAAASAFHAFQHNTIHARENGRTWQPKKQVPGFPDAGENGQPDAPGANPAADSYGRAQSGVQAGEDGERQTAAEQRQRFTPESEVVKGMREALGKGVNIMADLSAAHDHMGQLAAKRKQIRASGHPMTRRLMSQIDAEIAATKHDIVQLEEAHQHAMGEVGKFEAQMRNERIRANPIFQALMNAFNTLRSMGEKLGAGVAAIGDKAGEAIEGVKANMPEAKAKRESGARLDEALAGASQKQDLESRRAQALGQEDESSVVDVNKMHRDAALNAGASPDVLDALAGQGGSKAPNPTRGSDAENMARVLAVLGESAGEDTGPMTATGQQVAAPPGGEEAGEPPPVENDDGAPEGGSEADAAINDVLSTMPQGETPEKLAKQGPKDIEEDTGQWDADLKAKREKVEAAEQGESEALAPYSDMDTMSRLKAFGWGPKDETADTQEAPTKQRGGEDPTRAKSGVSPKGEREERGTVATGPKKRKGPPMNEAQKSLLVEGSELLAKSEPFARIMRLAPKVDRMLKAASAPRLVLDRRPNTNIFFTLYG